jgi:7,8-dihydropterin-6-yl-methyl-4-(beta-D-ribofuranosyl)aminobenzene 5'-phosphate synthase
MLDARGLKLTTIGENTSTRMGVLGEWGLSVLIEDGTRRFLLDTGAGASTLANADAMGVDLRGLDAIVLSHGHSDHTGGLLPVLARGGRETRVVAHPAVWGPKYTRNRANGKYRYCGVPTTRAALESAGARFEETAAPTWLSEDIVVSGQEPMSTAFEGVADSLFLRAGEAYELDPVLDDQSIYIRTNLGLVVVLGCAHRGMINILRHAIALTGVTDVHMVIGGTHLHPAPEGQVEQTIAALRQMGVRWIGVSHCTGMRAAARLAAALGDRFFVNNAGAVVTFPFSP